LNATRSIADASLDANATRALLEDKEGSKALAEMMEERRSPAKILAKLLNKEIEKMGVKGYKCKIVGKGKLNCKFDKKVKKRVRFCKRMTEIKKCLDPDKPTFGLNGKWHPRCPPSMRMTFPNLGNGRYTIIQSVDRLSVFRGLGRRVNFLPSDWSYLYSPEHLEWMEKFAASNKVFTSKFAESWQIISTKGWKEDQLAECNPVKCAGSGGKISCDVTGKMLGEMVSKPGTLESNLIPMEYRIPKKLEFVQCDDEASATGECTLTGGHGVRGKFDCGGKPVFCATEFGKGLEKEIEKEWQDGGGQRPICDEPN